MTRRDIACYVSILHTNDHMIGREKDHYREGDVARNVSTPHVLPVQKQPGRATDDKIPQQVETSQGDVTGHRSAVLLGGGTPIPWVTPTAVLHRSYGAFQRRNPPCPTSTKQPWKSTVDVDEYVSTPLVLPAEKQGRAP